MLRERKIGVNCSSSCSYLSSFLLKKFRLTQKTNSSKKGQVTVFIILGILLLLGVILFILFQQEIINLEGSQLLLPESGKVESFITDCLTSVGEEALRLSGRQGGFITVPSRYTQDLAWHLPLSPFLAMPFWARGTVIDQPGLEFIKVEVDNYIEQNVRACLLTSGAFVESYDFEENGPIESDVEFIDGRTIFNLEWNVLIKDKAGEVVAEVINHIAESEIRYKELYTLADQILDAEIATLKLEDITQDLIALEHPNLPVQGIEMSCSAREWRVDAAEQTLKDLLRVNVPELRIKGTDFVEFPDELPYYQNHYVWDVGAKAKGISATLKFDETLPFTFYVTPSTGTKMRSSQLAATEQIPFLCIQNWKFTYDVVYPVVVEVVDEKTGVAFNYALSVHLIRNFPNRGGQVIARESVTPPGSYNEEFCEENSYYVPMEVRTSSLVDNPESGVYVTEALDDAQVTYSCLRYKCDIGSTKYNYQALGDVSALISDFPYCSAAIMRAEKEGYTEAWEYVVPRENEVVELFLRPQFEVPVSKISLLKHYVNFRDCEDAEIEERGEDALCYDFGPGIPLNDVDTALFTFSVEVPTQETLSQPENESTEEYVFFEGVPEGYVEIHRADAVVSPAFDSNYATETQVSLLAGADFTYKTSINLVNEDSLLGGYELDWTPSWQELQNAEEIIFHVIEAGSEEELLLLISALPEVSEGLPLPEIR